MAESLEFLDGEPGVCRIAGLRNIMIIAWSERANGAAVVKLDLASKRMAAAYPSGFSAIHLIADKAGVPNPDARSGMMKIMSEQAKSIACVGIVVGGTGFWASTMRSFITGMRFMTPRNFDLRLHGTTAEVVEWLPKQHAKLTEISVDAKSLARVLDSVGSWPSETADLWARTSGTGT
jgi:hypothetical protein